MSKSGTSNFVIQIQIFKAIIFIPVDVLIYSNVTYSPILCIANKYFFQADEKPYFTNLDHTCVPYCEKTKNRYKTCLY